MLKNAIWYLLSQPNCVPVFPTFLIPISPHHIIQTQKLSYTSLFPSIPTSNLCLPWRNDGRNTENSSIKIGERSSASQPWGMWGMKWRTDSSNLRPNCPHRWAALALAPSALPAPNPSASSVFASYRFTSDLMGYLFNYSLPNSCNSLIQSSQHLENSSYLSSPCLHMAHQWLMGTFCNQAQEHHCKLMVPGSALSRHFLLTSICSVVSSLLFRRRFLSDHGHLSRSQLNFLKRICFHFLTFPHLSSSFRLSYASMLPWKYSHQWPPCCLIPMFTFSPCLLDLLICGTASVKFSFPLISLIHGFLLTPR